MDSALPKSQGLYDPVNEHDACGVGFVAHMKGVKSHSIVEQGLLILKNINHRGAVGADPLQGDGAGILIQIPDQLYRDDMILQGVQLPAAGEYGVGMIFLPREAASRKACDEEIERAVRAEGQVVLGWRDVPVDDKCPMSPTVKSTEPVIRQIFVGRGKDVLVTDALERLDYKIGGETSGHTVFREFFPTGDGLLTALQTLVVARSCGKPFSAIRGGWKRYPQYLKSVKVSEKPPLENVKGLKKLISDIESKIDGRVFIRYSGTEPLLRLLVEGENNDLVQAAGEEILKHYSSNSAAVAE